MDTRVLSVLGTNKLKLPLVLSVVMAVASAGTLPVRGGAPLWPPRQHSAEYRKAVMLFLRFQDALAAEQWPEALSLCSARVQAKAAEWPSAGAFFKDTVPIDLLLAQDFGYWRNSSDSYGLMVPLTEPKANPALRWFWAIAAANGTWVVDFPPAKLEQYVAQKKAALEERGNKAKQLSLSLQPKLKGVKTRLGPLNKEFVVGSPMPFRITLENQGQTAVDYMLGGLYLSVRDDKGQTPPQTLTGAQVQVRKGQVAPGASVIVADQIDISAHYAITNPGTYVVQFNGTGLEIGQPVPSWTTPALFGEDEGQLNMPFGFFSLTNRIPSEPIQTEVLAGRKQ